VNIVYSHNKIEGVETTTKSPVELIKELEARGFKEVAVCGGTTIYTMFMKAKVVDRLFITIEPILFGSGLKLFNDDMLFHLKLVSAQESSEGSLLLEYAVDYTGNPKTLD
jgi:dihydrofolate reductase